MATRTIKAITTDWNRLTNEVIGFRDVSVSQVRQLLLETYTLLHALSQRRTVPKSLCGLLYEMQNFSWWINDLKNSSLHGFYPLFICAIDEMRKEFISGETDTKTIARFLNGKLD